MADEIKGGKRYAIGFLCDARNAEPTFFLEMLQSLMLQEYTDWALVVATDPTGLARMQAILQDYETRDHRIKVCRLTQFPDQSELLWQLCGQVVVDFVMDIGKHEYLAYDALLRIVTMLNDRPYLDRIVAREGYFDNQGGLALGEYKSDAVILTRQSRRLNAKNVDDTSIDVTKIGAIPAVLKYIRR